jgi:hypothetical protein
VRTERFDHLAAYGLAFATLASGSFHLISDQSMVWIITSLTGTHITRHIATTWTAHRGGDNKLEMEKEEPDITLVA